MKKSFLEMYIFLNNKRQWGIALTGQHTEIKISVNVCRWGKKGRSVRNPYEAVKATSLYHYGRSGQISTKCTNQMCTTKSLEMTHELWYWSHSQT